MEIKMFGHYYRMFKGTGGIPTKVTVVGIEGDIVTLVRGHLTKEDFEERSEDLDEAIKLFCLTKMKCNKNKMLTSLTPKQQRLIEKEDREIERMIMQVGCALDERFVDSGISTDEFIDNYEEKYSSCIEETPLSGTFKYEVEDTDISGMDNIEEDQTMSIWKIIDSIIIAYYEKRNYAEEMEEKYHNVVDEVLEQIRGYLLAAAPESNVQS